MSILRTGFVASAKEGETIDGRKIDAQWIKDIVETYDPENTYKAMVQPDHYYWGVIYGGVEAVKYETDSDGKLVLYADYSPNSYWMDDVKNGQRQFCSIAVQTNFAGTGKAYLVGVGATNTPASLGTQQIEFAKRPDAKNKGLIFSDTYELNMTFTNEDADDDDIKQAASFFARLFTSHKSKQLNTDNTMPTISKAEFDTLKNDFAALTEDIKALKQGDDQGTTASEKYAALEQENAELKLKLEQQATQFTGLEAKLTTLTDAFNAALKDEIPGSQDQHDFTKKQDDSVYA